MKKQLKLLFFVAMLVTLVVMTMVFASASGEYQLTRNDNETPEPFDTLNAAVAAVQSTDTNVTITVTAPVTADATSIAGKTLTINGGNNLITVSKGTAWLTVSANADVTLQGINLTYTGASDDTTKIITVNDAKLTVSGKNIFTFNAAGATEAALIHVNNDSAVVNVIGGVKSESADDRVAIHQNNNGIGLLVDAGFLYVKNVFMTDNGAKLTPALVKVAGGEAFVEDSEFLATSSSKNSYSLVAAGGLLNIKNCAVTGFNVITVTDKASVVNVMGSKTVVRTITTSTNGGALAFTAAGEINVLDGEFFGNQPVCFTSGGGTLNLYGGKLVNEGKGYALYFKVAGTLNVKNKDTDTYTVKSQNKDYAKFTAMGAELRSKAAVMFMGENKASNVSLGNGTKIYLENNCSFDGRFKGYATFEVGEIEYHCLDSMTDNDSNFLNPNGTKLPAIEKDKWANTTFYILPPAMLNMLSTDPIVINSKTDLVAKADKSQDTTMATWGGSYKGFEYVEGAIPGFILKSGTSVTLKNNNETYEDLLTLFTVEAGAELIIEGNVFKAAASTAGFTPIIQVNGGSLVITGENTRFIAEDWTFNYASDHKGLIHATAGSAIEINCGGTHTPIIDNNLENINNVQANFVASKNGYLIALDGDGITVTVNGGVFLRKSGEVISGNANHTTYSTGSVFGIWGDLTEDSTSKITINGGYFYSHSMVRIFASAQKSETVGETTVTTPCKGWTVEIKGGTFVTNSTGGTEEYPNGGTSTANNNAFQIQAPGVHTITFTEDCTAKVYANENSLALFSVITKAGLGYQNYGCAIDILGGEFEFANIFFNTPNTIGNVSLKIKKAVLTQSANSTSAIIVMPNTTEFGPSSITLEGASIYAGTGSNLIRTVGNVDVSITGGIYAAGALIVNVVPTQLTDGADPEAVLENVSETVKSFTVKGGTIILLGENANWYYYDNVEVTEGFDPIIVAKANTLIKEGVTLGEYSPVVKYGNDLKLKVWMSFAADESGYAPELVPGAGLYLGENGNSVTDEGCGIRFKSTISKRIYDELLAPAALEERGYYLVSFGTLIAPADYVAAAGAFTVNALQKLEEATGKKSYITVDAYHADDRLEEEWGCVDNGDGTLSFAVALINLRNDERSYAAVPYVCYTDGNGNFEYIYGAFNSVDNARSATQIEALLNQ